MDSGEGRKREKEKERTEKKEGNQIWRRFLFFLSFFVFHFCSLAAGQVLAHWQYTDWPRRPRFGHKNDDPLEDQQTHYINSRQIEFRLRKLGWCVCWLFALISLHIYIYWPMSEQDTAIFFRRSRWRKKKWRIVKREQPKK